MNTDLHIHSCLSPCGDDAMTPEMLVGMSLLNGVELIALTDHNSVRNCPAAAAAAEAYGIGFIPGCEVTTAEDVHCVCLFPDLERAMAFGTELENYLAPVANRPEIFGNQIILHPDGSTETYERLLLPACSISIVDLPAFARDFGAICYPAHVDRDANGLFAMLGLWPEDLITPAVEIRNILPAGVPDGLKTIMASDSHYLHALPQNGFPLPLEEASFRGLAKYLKVDL